MPVFSERSPPKQSYAQICVVDDDESVADSLNSLLETFGYDVHSYKSGEDFLADHRRRATGCLVIDQHMPGMDGLDVVDRLQKQGTRVPTIAHYPDFGPARHKDEGAGRELGRNQRAGKTLCGPAFGRPHSNGPVGTEVMPPVGYRLQNTIFRYVFAVSWPHQIALVVLTVVTFLLEVAPLEIQRRVVNDLVKERSFNIVVILCAAYAGVVLVQGATKLSLNVYR